MKNKAIYTAILLLINVACANIAFGQTVGAATIKYVAKEAASLADDSAKLLKRYTDDAGKASTKYVVVASGNSRILGTRIGTPNGYAAHHIIPSEVRSHRALQKIGIDLDEARNGISLPMYPGVDPILPLHRGSHPEYTSAVLKKLDEIPESLSISETRHRVDEVEDYFRAQLGSGKPLHANLGGEW